MEEKEVEEIINYINFKYNENVPSIAKMIVRKKIKKIRTFEIDELPKTLRDCKVEDLLLAIKQALETGKLKL